MSERKYTTEEIEHHATALDAIGANKSHAIIRQLLGELREARVAQERYKAALERIASILPMSRFDGFHCKTTAMKALGLE